MFRRDTQVRPALAQSHRHDQFVVMHPIIRIHVAVRPSHMKEGKCERCEQSSFNDCRCHWSFSFLNRAVLAKFIQLAYSDSGGDATSPCMLSQIVMPRARSGVKWPFEQLAQLLRAGPLVARVPFVCFNFDEVIVQEGLFGINGHRSNPKTESAYVENWSEGCQVFKRVKDFNEFMELCEKARAIHGNSFTYTLLESKDLV